MTNKAIDQRTVVDVFWDRQGWYFVHAADSSKISEEFEDLDACVRHVVLNNYKLRDVRRTRGAVPAPKMKVPERKPNDAE